MSLADSFPDALKKESARRVLRPGAVIKIETNLDGDVKVKRLVVVHVDASTVTCVINSNDWHFKKIAKSQNVNQVDMKVDDHPFMDHDSFVDCSRFRTFDTDEVLDAIEASRETMLGAITEAMRDDMVFAIQHSTLIAPAEKNYVVASLRSYSQAN